MVKNVSYLHSDPKPNLKIGHTHSTALSTTMETYPKIISLDDIPIEILRQIADHGEHAYRGLLTSRRFALSMTNNAIIDQMIRLGHGVRIINGRTIWYRTNANLLPLGSCTTQQQDRDILMHLHRDGNDRMCLGEKLRVGGKYQLLNFIKAAYRLHYWDSHTHAINHIREEPNWNLAHFAHRLDGPAVSCPDGTLLWVVDGVVRSELAPPEFRG